MRFRLSQAYLLLGLLAIGGYFLLPAGAFKDSFYYNAVGLSGVVAIVLGVRKYRPDRALPWYLFAGGQLLLVVGDVEFSVYEHVLKTSPFPSVADGFYLSGYPLLAVGLLLLIRSRSPGSDWASLIDASIIATGAGVVSWVVLMVPYARDPGLSLPARLF